MNEVTIFQNTDFGVVRAVTLDDAPWFVAADVCRALGIGNSRDATAKLDDDEKNTVALTDGNRGNPNVCVVNEPGLYTLVLGSRKPEAKAFKRWITHEVIPAIRKTGGYIATKPDETPEEIMARALVVANETLARHRQQLEAANAKIEADAPKVLFAETVAKAKNCILVREMAKIISQHGVPMGEKRLFDLLRNDGFIIKAEGRDKNSPTQKSMEMGLMRIKESAVSDAKGTHVYKTPLITGKGQQYFLSKYAAGKKDEAQVQEVMRL